MLSDELINKLGRSFAEAVAKVSFMLWQKRKFRKLINFEKISQTEKDRIFNELEITFLGLFYLSLSNLAFQLDENPESQIVEKLKSALIKGFISIYRDLNIEEKFISDWEILIDMRFKEYQLDFQILLKEGERVEEINKGQKLVWARVRTIALDSLSHIRRGKLDKDDPLKKYLEEWVVGTDKIYSDTIKEIIFKPVAHS